MSIIYDSVFLPIIGYGAPAWADGLGKIHIDSKLQSAQRRALLHICRAYSTAPTAALQVIASKLPVTLHLEIVVQRWRMRKGQNVLLNGVIFDNIESTNSCTPSVPPYDWPYIGGQPWPDQSFSVFTDGSKNNDGVGCAFVVYHGNLEVYNFSDRLGNTCSAFQAELWAILKAIKWSNEELRNTNINLFTDSSSSLQAIHNFNWGHPIVNEILREMTKNVNRFSVVWIGGHSGVLGNERADELARTASVSSGTPTYTATPQNYIISSLKEKATELWQGTWNLRTNSITRDFFPQSQLVIIIILNIEQHSFTGHGKFNSYFFRFNKTTEQNCELCNIPDGARHYLLQCPMLDDKRSAILSLLPSSGNWPQDLHVLLQDNNLFQAFRNLVTSYFRRTTVN
ncbi:uncharacterized protein [Centruroides vittatus]|uniref:uncharacterized protein n=1 Tax=Centruroides vittatus TaxID=120091 RepID=UPI00350F182D